MSEEALKPGRLDFRTDIALIEAYTKNNAEPDNILAEEKAVYLPHLYRGGKVIPGFGYSTQRIENGYFTKETAGDPLLAMEWVK